MSRRVRRSQERLVFYYKARDTATTVKRSSIQRAARALGMDETGFLHVAAAALVRSLRSGGASSGRPVGSARLTDDQLAAIRSLEPQEVVPTRSFLEQYVREHDARKRAVSEILALSRTSRAARGDRRWTRGELHDRARK